jgi:hypothetical protein
LVYNAADKYKEKNMGFWEKILRALGMIKRDDSSDNNIHDENTDDSGVFEHRTIDEVEEMAGELTDKVWYNRHQDLKIAIEEGEEECDPQIWKDAEAQARKMEEKYGIENLGPWDDFEWGMINGKLSALRWILGFEWDMLDT